MRTALVITLAGALAVGCDRGPEPERIVVAGWSLPGDVQLSETTVEITALLTAPGCTDGVTEANRLVGPDIDYTDDSVVVSFQYRLPLGFATCPRGPALAVPVRLREPLGGRDLLDGATDPPVAPSRCDPARLCAP